jgi:hypothetical protein
MFCLYQIWFEFDVNAFADEDFSAAPEPPLRSEEKSYTNDPVTSMQETVQTQPPQPTQTESIERRQYQEEPQSETQYYSASEGGRQYGNDGGGGNDDDEDRLLDEKFKSVLMSNGQGDTCLEEAYSRFISNLEKDAIQIEAMENEIRRHEDNAHQRAEQSKQNRQQQVEELQVFIKQQMAEKRNEREIAEKESRKPWIASSQAPILTRDAGVADVGFKKYAYTDEFETITPTPLCCIVCV